MDLELIIEREHWASNTQVFLWDERSFPNRINEALSPCFHDTQKYWELFQNDDVLYCSVWEFDIEKIKSCIHFWIVSESERVRGWRKVIKKYKTHLWYNGNDYVSVSFPPTFSNRWEWYNSFLWYSMRKWNVSFVIDRKKSPALVQKYKNTWYWISEFYDEWIVHWKIPPTSIIWIMFDNEWFIEKCNQQFIDFFRSFWLKLYNKEWKEFL